MKPYVSCDSNSADRRSRGSELDTDQRRKLGSGQALLRQAAASLTILMYITGQDTTRNRSPPFRVAKVQEPSRLSGKLYLA